jgi:hypothetical protein
MDGGPEGVWISADKAKRRNSIVTTRSPSFLRRNFAADGRIVYRSVRASLPAASRLTLRPKMAGPLPAVRTSVRCKGDIMKLPRRRFLHLAAGAAAVPVVSCIARAQTYPTKLVRLIVGFAVGGPNDILARIMGAWRRPASPFPVSLPGDQIISAVRLWVLCHQ